MAPITLNGFDLTRQQVIEIACNNAKVSVDASRISESRDYVVKKVNDGRIVYGVTTGFGSNADKPIKKDDAEALQVNLLRSHSCGVGNNFSREIVRAVMAIRLNTLLKGNSGIQETTVRQLEFLLNNEIHPVIPEQGSVGASGDLCPLSHMALPIIGEGQIEYKGDEYSTEQFLRMDEAKQIGFSKATLSYKEGLALNNGTTVMTAVGTIALHKAERLLKVSTLTSALIFESLGARRNAFGFAKLHAARNHSGQSKIAQWLTNLLSDSRLVDISQNEILNHVISNNLIADPEILAVLKELNAIDEPDKQQQIPAFVIHKLRSSGPSDRSSRLNDLADILFFARKKWTPQDSYSIRCLPQVFGASKSAIDHVISIVDNELNAAVDNPLIFVGDDKVISGGNFHGQPIALVMDYLKIAVAEIGNITERQINKLVDAATNDGLPSFLINDTGLNSGLMIPQYAAAGIVSENKVLVHPASTDSIPTCENTEDHVSMGLIAARQALQIVENAEKITAIAILVGFYAISMRLQQFGRVKMENKPENILAKATLEFYLAVQASNENFDNGNEFLSKDRYLSPEIKALHSNFATFASIADKYIS